MKKDKKEIPMWAKLGHPKPVSRREFLATGIIPFSAWALAPSLSTFLLSPEARAQATDCSGSAGPTYIPFITLNLAGGSGLHSQLVVKNLNGENLTSYNKLGLGAGPGLSFNPVKEFGNVEFSGTAIGGNTTGLVSKFLTGVRDPRAQNTRITALDNTAFIWSAVASTDDNSNNPFDVSGLAVKMGLTGTMLANLGVSDTTTGINQKPALVPPPAPFVVGNVNDLANALGYASSLKDMSQPQQLALARAISKFSGSQIRRIASTTGSTFLEKVIECAGLRNADLLAKGVGDVNPLAVGGALSTEIARIWGIQVTDRTSRSAVFGSLVYNALVGNASTVGLNLGGHDYHDNTRTTGDARDLEAGQIIGKILETAAFVKKPVFIYVCSDGAVVSAASATADAPWASDRGIAGMQYMLAYHPTGRPLTSGFQIGGFNDGQAADGKFPTSTNPELAAQAVFANYAAWNGRMDFLEQYRVLGDSALREKAIKLRKA